MTNWKRGVYVDPRAVAAHPDYAKRLVEEAGVDHFVMRSSYGLNIPEAVGQASQIARDLKADVCLMTGTFWGDANIKPVEGLATKSHESQYPMELPGTEIDTGVVAKLEKMCRENKPDAICLTHARFRHPGYMDSVFYDGKDDPAFCARMEAGGIPRPEVDKAKAEAEKALAAADKGWLLKKAESGLIAFLGELTQNDVWERYFAFRRRIVSASYRAFAKTVKRFPGIAFGTNAYNPTAARVTGLDYENFDDICEFVQPLMPYMEFHVYQPIAAVAYYVKSHTRLDEPTAVEVARRLLFLGDTVCPDSISELDNCGEGKDDAIRSLVGRQLQLSERYLSKPYQLLPVLRGRDWGRGVTDELLADMKKRGFSGVVFMGCDYLVPNPPPAEGWLGGWF